MIITPQVYIMGRDVDYPLPTAFFYNMADLLSRVNYLIARLKIQSTVTSGYRPGHYNTLAGGSKESLHLTCRAIDLLDDEYGRLGTLLFMRKEVLEEAGLWLESPKYTQKKVNDKIVRWVHLDTKQRTNRVFNPY